MEENNFRVTQANQLVSSAYGMTLLEKRLLLLSIAKLSPDNKNFPRYELSAKTIQHYLGINQRSFYRELEKAAHKLMTRVASIETENGWTKFNFFHSMKYQRRNKNKEAHLVVQLHEEMAPFLLELKERFNSIPFSQLVSMTSTYAIRLFEILWHDMHKNGKSPQLTLRYELSTLRLMLGVDTPKQTTKKIYPQWGHFETNAIKQAQKNFNNRTPLKFEYTTEKTSRKITAVVFHLEENSEYIHNHNPFPTAQKLLDFNKTRSETSKDKYRSEAAKMLFELIPGHQVLKIFNDFEGRDEVLIENVKYVADQIRKKPTSIKNPAGFLIDALNNNYARV